MSVLAPGSYNSISLASTVWVGPFGGMWVRIGFLHNDTVVLSGQLGSDGPHVGGTSISVAGPMWVGPKKGIWVWVGIKENKDPHKIKVRKRERERDREAACLQAASPEVTYKQLLKP